MKCFLTALTRAVKREGLDWSGWVGRGRILVWRAWIEQSRSSEMAKKFSTIGVPCLTGAGEFSKEFLRLEEYAFSLYDTYSFPDLPTG